MKFKSALNWNDMKQPIGDPGFERHSYIQVNDNHLGGSHLLNMSFTGYLGSQWKISLGKFFFNVCLVK